MSQKVAIGRVVPAVVPAGLPLAGKFSKRNAAPSPTGTGGTTCNLVSVDGHPIPCSPIHAENQAPEVSRGSFTINNDGLFTGPLAPWPSGLCGLAAAGILTLLAGTLIRVNAISPWGLAGVLALSSMCIFGVYPSESAGA